VGGGGKGSWLSRINHRASHIPNRPLPLRTPGSAGSGGSGNSGFPGINSRSHDNLPVLQKTTSYPASPNSPASPDTEFGGTPIDASFGERVEPPPDRPAPEKPTFGDRAGLPSQRSRSGTATQLVEVARKPVAKKMDKYARQAGDDDYESEGADADDEFERTVFSPTVPTHFDEGESDHPSESEEEHESIDGEDTPTTQGWGERDGRSPTGLITQWTDEQVADYISTLSPHLKQYSMAFVEEGVDGTALVALQHDELKELGIASAGHRLTILKAVYEQKLRSGVKIEEGDYVPLSAEGDKSEMTATQDDITRVIESLRLRDQRILAAEAELKAMKQDLDRIFEENRKLREETLPIMRLVKDQRTPLPDPSGGTLPSPRDMEAPKQNENLAPGKETKGSSLSRKFSTKKLFLGGAPKQPSPTHPPQSHTPQPSQIRDDPGGTQLEASAAAMAASSHLTASMTSQISPNSIHGSQLSPTSPAYSTQAPSSGGSYHQPGSGGVSRSFPRDGTQSARHPPHDRHVIDDTGTGYSTSSHWSQASTIVASDRDRDRDPPASARPSRRQAPTPSPREDEVPQTAPLPRDRDRSDRTDRDNPQVEIFKSFRVSIEDPCRVVLPVVRSVL
jgi:protein STE50